MKFIGYSLRFTKHYVDSGVAVRDKCEVLRFKEDEEYLLNLIVEALEKHGRDNPGTDQRTGEKFWIGELDWERVYE